MLFKKEKLIESLESDSKHLETVFDGYYGIEEKPDIGSCYILPNGKFLNLFPATHIAFEYDLDEYDVPFPYLKDSIKVNDGKNPQDPLPYPYLHIKSRPTDAQYESLLNWLYTLGNSDLDVWVVRGSAFYNLREYIPEEIIKKIKKYFITNRLEEKKDIK